MSIENYMARRFGVRVTHLPTGISAQCDGSVVRTIEEAENKMLRVLRARVAAARKPKPGPNITTPEEISVSLKSAFFSTEPLNAIDKVDTVTTSISYLDKSEELTSEP